MSPIANIGPKQRWLRGALGCAVIAGALLADLGPATKLLLALVGAGSVASGATGF